MKGSSHFWRFIYLYTPTFPLGCIRYFVACVSFVLGLLVCVFQQRYFSFQLGRYSGVESFSLIYIFDLGLGNEGRNPKTSREGRRPSGLIVSLIALIDSLITCLSVNVGCCSNAVFRIRREEWCYPPPCRIALWDSIPLNCKVITSSIVLFLTFSEVNRDSLSNPMVSGEPVYTISQQMRKSFLSYLLLSSFSSFLL